jgi:hypothetical protein
MFSISFFYASVQLGAGNTMHMNEKTRSFLACFCTLFFAQTFFPCTFLHPFFAQT